MVKLAVSTSLAAVSALGCFVLLGGAAFAAVLLFFFPPGKP